MCEWDPAIPSVAACSPAERSVLARQLQTGLGCARTSSMGRLFDAVSSIAGVCHRVAYEAEAAMLFEALAHGAVAGCDHAYAFGLSGDDVPWTPIRGRWSPRSLPTCCPVSTHR